MGLPPDLLTSTCRSLCLRVSVCNNIASYVRLNTKEPLIINHHHQRRHQRLSASISSTTPGLHTTPSALFPLQIKCVPGGNSALATKPFTLPPTPRLSLRRLYPDATSGDHSLTRPWDRVTTSDSWPPRLAELAANRAARISSMGKSRRGRVGRTFFEPPSAPLLPVPEMSVIRSCQLYQIAGRHPAPPSRILGMPFQCNQHHHRALPPPPFVFTFASNPEEKLLRTAQSSFSAF